MPLSLQTLRITQAEKKVEEEEEKKDKEIRRKVRGKEVESGLKKEQALKRKSRNINPLVVLISPFILLS